MIHHKCLARFLPALLPLFLLAPGVAPGVVLAESNPDALVKRVTEEVLSILRKDKGIQSGDRRKAVALIEDKVAPHFDFTRMTSLAVGRAWRQADAGQRKALSGEFRILLVRTYANALTAYRDQTVSFQPSSKPGADGEVTVHSQIHKPGARPISLDYSLAKSDEEWKVFDVSIANVSLVTNYRSTFAEEVGKGGLDGLLKSLQDKNRRLETAAPPAA